MKIENGTTQPEQPILPAISKASDIFTPQQKKDLQEQLKRLREERIKGANAVLELRIVLD